MSEPPENPFRVRQNDDFFGPPLTQPQQKCLSALVVLCPESGNGVDARRVAEDAQIRLGSVVVILRSLVKRRLALVHDGEPELWAPTMTGRSRVRHYRSIEERKAAQERAQHDDEGDPPAA